MLKTFMLILAAPINGEQVESEAPSDTGVLRPIPRAAHIKPFRDDIIIVKNVLVSQKLYVPLPVVAWIAIEKNHWECTVYATKVTKSSSSSPSVKTQAQVVHLNRTAVVVVSEQKTRY